MKKNRSLYHGHRFPTAIIGCAVRWYYKYQLSLRDVKELLFERGVTVTYETIRRWCEKFGAGFELHAIADSSQSDLSLGVNLSESPKIRGLVSYRLPHPPAFHLTVDKWTKPLTNLAGISFT